jgi:hypothetical protein
VEAKLVQNFEVTSEELINTVRTWHIVPEYVPVRLGPGTLEAPLPKMGDKWWWDGLIDGDVGIAEIEIYEVRHLRIQTLSEEVLLRLSFKSSVEVMNRYKLRLDDEITLFFYRRS